jgi:Flp pilus assembly pilin Flp
MLKLFASYMSAALSSKKGISPLEYAILAGVLLGLISTAITAFGTDISALFGNAGTRLTGFSTNGIGTGH